MSTSTDPKFDSWALVELFGHQRIVGRVTEGTLAGGAFLRVDVPQIEEQEAYTRYFGPSAIYSLNPLKEEVARQLLTMAAYRNAPVNEYAFPKLAERTSENDDDDPDSGKDNRYGGNDS
jgi:hypothetical protein